MKGFLILVVVGLFSVSAFAQNEKGQLVVSVGIGYSPEFDGDISIFDEQSYPVKTNGTWGNHFGFSCSAIPNVGGSVDYCFLKQLSIGLAGSYQNENVSWSPDYPRAYATDNISRTNLAARILFHLNKPDPDADFEFDHYISFRLGVCYWTDVQTFAATYSFAPTFLSNPNSSSFAFQFAYGIKFYLVNDFVVHFEVGIGQPFLAECGFAYRFHTRKDD